MFIDLYNGSNRSCQILSDCEVIMSDLIDHKHSIRECSCETKIPRATIHKYIHNYISEIDSDTYTQIQNLLNYNKKHTSHIKLKGCRYR